MIYWIHFLVGSALPLLICYPIARAFLRSLQLVRNPAVRVAPESPSVLFRWAFRRRLRRWPLVWVILILIHFLMDFGDSLGGAFIPFSIVTFGRATEILFPDLGICFLSLAFYQRFAPFFKSAWVLALIGFFASVLLMNAYDYTFFVLYRLRYIPFGFDARGIQYVLCPQYLLSLPFTAVIALGNWRSVRAMGSRWFRFKEH